MERKSTTFNANDWTGTIHTVQYLILEGGAIEFRFQNEDFKIIFTTEKEEGFPYIFINGKCYDTHSSEYPIVKVSKFDSSDSDKPGDTHWTATDDDFGGITRDHTDPVAAVCQILSNIM